MALGFYEAYRPIDNETYYREYSQEWVDRFFDDSTLVRNIREEKYPFNNIYEEFQTHIDTVSEMTTNLTKVEGDYLSVIYKDCSHQTYRGQKIIYDNKFHLVYQKTEPLSRIAKSKIIKCNNKISFIDKSNGEIITEPIFIGYELSSTNNNITKDATIENRRLICLIQGNKHTSKFVENQRFLLSKSKAFKITQINDVNKDDIYEEYPTMITLYIEWSSVLPSDNLDLLIADYYDYNYTVSINSTGLQLAPNSIGQLSAIVKLNGVEQNNIPLQWSTSDNSALKIDSLGNYQVVGLSGYIGYIECNIQGNNSVNDRINVEIVDVPIENKEIRITPNDETTIKQGRSLDVFYGVYNGDVLTSDVVTITPSGASNSNYSIAYSSGKVIVTNLLKTNTKLVLTFTSGTLEQQEIEITLLGIL